MPRTMQAERDRGHIGKRANGRSRGWMAKEPERSDGGEETRPARRGAICHAAPIWGQMDVAG